VGERKRESDKVFIGYSRSRVRSPFSIPSDTSNARPSSRKQFIPPDGWLVTSKIDVNSFIEAAVCVSVFFLLTIALTPYQSRRTTTVHIFRPPTRPHTRSIKAANRQHVTTPWGTQQHPLRHSLRSTCRDLSEFRDERYDVSRRPARNVFQGLEG